jgi:hypothetical protein
MKIKVVLTGLAVAGFAVSSALAAAPADKGKPATTGAGCKPRIAVVLKGTLAGTPGALATSISVNLKSGNHWGAAYVKATQPTSINVDGNTKIRRQGQKTLASLLSGDRVLVQARVCMVDLANSATPKLTASKVIAQSPTAAKDDKDDKDDD